MIVNYFGEGCFRLQSGDTSLLVDPSSNRFKADVTMRTTTPVDVTGVPAGEIAFPGEYEVKGIEITGYQVQGESSEKVVRSVYHVRFEELSFAFLGTLSKALDADIIEKIGEPDVVCLAFDGDRTLSAEQAAKLIKQIGPHVVATGLSKRTSEVLKIFGQKSEAQEKFVFKRKDIQNDVERLVVLKS